MRALADYAHSLGLKFGVCEYAFEKWIMDHVIYGLPGTEGRIMFYLVTCDNMICNSNRYCSRNAHMSKKTWVSWLWIHWRSDILRLGCWLRQNWCLYWCWGPPHLVDPLSWRLWKMLQRHWSPNCSKRGIMQWPKDLWSMDWQCSKFMAHKRRYSEHVSLYILKNETKRNALANYDRNCQKCNWSKTNPRNWLRVNIYLDVLMLWM